jgi:flagellar biosynthetic protein FliQ
MNAVADFGRDAFTVFLFVGGPAMSVALIVGVTISILQTMTQVQEQTLVAIPKIISVGLAIVIAMPFMAHTLFAFMERIANRIATGG